MHGYKRRGGGALGTTAVALRGVPPVVLMAPASAQAVQEGTRSHFLLRSSAHWILSWVYAWARFCVWG